MINFERLKEGLEGMPVGIETIFESFGDYEESDNDELIENLDGIKNAQSFIKWFQSLDSIQKKADKFNEMLDY